MTRSISLHQNVRPILAEIRTVPIPPKPGHEPSPPAVAPFITISREAGAGAWTLARQLVEAINAVEPDESRWTCWDRELMQKVAADMHLSEEMIESLEYASHSWLSDFLSSLSFSDSAPCADEARIYGRVVATVRALAKGGRVVIVGCGGLFITRRMTGGIHIRMVAPFEDRVAFMARQRNLPHKAAMALVKQLEHNRAVFYRRYWPGESLAPESFALTINTAAVSQDVIIDVVRCLVRAKVSAAVRA